MKNYLTKLVCIALIAALSWSGFGNVLCYGTDGHVAVEPAFHDHCHGHGAPSEHRHREAHGLAIEALDDCNPCVDVLLGHDGEPIRLKNTVSFGDIGTGIPFYADVSPLTAAANNTTYNTFSFFTPLKSIILLT